MAFFSLKEPRRFQHKPIFYDEDKEFHDALVNKAKKDLGMETDGKRDFRSSVKGSFRAGGESSEKITFNFRRTAERKSSRHVFVLVALLLCILFFISKL